jgi:shikimate dehydrogenase
MLGGSPVMAPRSGSYGLVANTTSVGLHGEDPFDSLPLTTGLNGGQTVVDLAYGSSPTKLIEAAEKAGARTVDGIDILVHQGARSFEIWTGRKPPLGVMYEAARADSLGAA